LSSCRPLIVRTYAAWTSLSALRSGAPIKSRADVYPLLETVPFDAVLSGSRPISRKEFDEWHRDATLGLRRKERRLNVGWATKILNVYLKTAAYIGSLGRPGLASVIHPPIDAGLWQGIERKFGEDRALMAMTHVVSRIKDIQEYRTYALIIEGCRQAAGRMGCNLVEVEQLWEGAMVPIGDR
jgi:hypothetical protein